MEILLNIQVRNNMHNGVGRLSRGIDSNPFVEIKMSFGQSMKVGQFLCIKLFFID